MRHFLSSINPTNRGCQCEEMTISLSFPSALQRCLFVTHPNFNCKLQVFSTWSFFSEPKRMCHWEGVVVVHDGVVGKKNQLRVYFSWPNMEGRESTSVVFKFFVFFFFFKTIFATWIFTKATHRVFHETLDHGRPDGFCWLLSKKDFHTSGLFLQLVFRLTPTRELNFLKSNSVRTIKQNSKWNMSTFPNLTVANGYGVSYFMVERVQDGPEWNDK